MSYVTHVFMTVFGYPKAKATELMLDVHERGQGRRLHRSAGADGDGRRPPARLRALGHRLPRFVSSARDGRRMKLDRAGPGSGCGSRPRRPRSWCRPSTTCSPPWTRWVPGDAVWERLYPAAFADVDAADEFREMVGEDLDNARRERLRACRAEVLAADTAPRRRQDLTPRGRGPATVDHRAERSAAGARHPPRASPPRPGRTIDPFSPTAHDQAIYQWLTAVQDGLVDAAMA